MFAPQAESVDNESGVGDISEMDNDDTEADGSSGEGCAEAQAGQKAVESEDESWTRPQNVVLTSMDELTSVIVGAVMKKAMADLYHIAQAKVAKDPRIIKLFPDEKYDACRERAGEGVGGVRGGVAVRGLGEGGGAAEKGPSPTGTQHLKAVLSTTGRRTQKSKKEIEDFDFKIPPLILFSV